MATSEDFGLRRLFRPPVGHLSVKEQLKLCSTRDLGKSALYRTAAKIWGAPNRTRVLIARSTDENPENEAKEVVERQAEAASAEKSTEEDEMVDYHRWMTERRQLRGDLDSLGLNAAWLRSKRDKTDIEGRVLERMERPVFPLPLNKPEPKKVSPKRKVKSRGRGVRPKLDLPLPDALTIIEEFVQKNRLRLVDLFARFDKDKNWRVSKAEFRRVFKLAAIPVSDRQLDSLILALDKDDNNELDYKELVRGRQSLKKLLRDAKRDISSRTSMSSSPLLGGTPTILEEGEERKSPSMLLPIPKVSTSEKVKMVSREAKMTERKRVRKMKRKQEKTAAVVHKEISVQLERHCAVSTIGCGGGGAVGEAVNAYREMVRREYEAALHLCRMNGVDLTKEILEKALLYPGDRPVGECQAKLRQPGLDLLSRKDLEIPDSSPKKSSRLRSSHAGFGAPSTRLKRVKLSTGWAKVGPKTDCWLTYEEYEALTRQLQPKFDYKRKSRSVDSNAFWPGSLLDRLRVYLPSDVDRKTASVENIFSSVTKPLRNPDSLIPSYLKSGLWPVNDAGYVQHGGRGKKQYQL